MDDQDVLNIWIPYRLQGIQTLWWAYNQLHDLPQPRELQVLVDGKQILGGNASAVLNPMVEAGFIHARCLLEFLGLGVKKGKLITLDNRRADDMAIEHFNVDGVALEKVTPDAVLSAYTGPRDRGEHALVAIFELANKGLAHFTRTFPDGYNSVDLEIACRGIPVLVQNHLYTKLKKQAPEAPKPA
ncbi:hypothetical protein [Dyella caseinilytica]|uniref:Uncharacterized protein n=1 Tax=Dyella caseinilytica TaxID=1849581 RepID=A0ABX7GQN1_9GAMM|nr:hypothetical protein [Dyella caseinilytica]QRN52239.1 hypothetical protein ISN74_12140 [Dyella caseinilytica]GGA14261.1 hypothetical protein GCM10011408_40020 [Dyella caseinilytica]